MMQELQTIGAPETSLKGTITGRSFAVLFALAGPKPMDSVALERRLGITERECRRVVDDLHRRYLIDLVSRLDGRKVRETLRLTEDGEAVLARSLEQMCELPELS